MLVGDSGEFQFTGAILGIPHPTGYPLYTLLGKAWSLLPLGTVAYRINLSSACYMAAAVALLAWLIRQVSAAGAVDSSPALFSLWMRRLAVLGGAGLFAVAGTVWAQAVVARSYALNALLLAGCLAALWTWWVTGRRAAGWAFAALLGLSLAHHGTTAVLLPGYTWLSGAALWRRRGRDQGAARRRWWAGMVGALALGLSPYLLFAYRFVFGYTYYWGNPQTWDDVLILARGGPFTGQFFAYPLTIAGQLSRVMFGLDQLSLQFGGVGVALGLAGLLRLLLDARTRPFGVGLALLVAGNFAFAVNYGIIGHIYLIPTYLCWALFMAAGGLWPLDWAANLRRPGPRGMLRIGGGLVVALVALLVVPGLAAARLPAQDRSGDTRIRDLALTTLAAAEPGARIYVDWESLCVFRYYRFVEGRRPDLDLYSEDPRDWAPGIARDLAAGRAAYVGGWAGADPPAAVRQAYRLERVGLVYRVLGPAPGE